MAANTENDVFLSYSHQDEAFVEMLKDKLRERGFDAWQDRTDLQIGKEWDVQILRAIRRRRALAFVISPEALQSKYCLRELNHARRWGKVVVPILRRPIPDGWEAKITNAAQRKRAVTAWNWMRKIQYVDFLPDDDHNFEFSLNRLQLGLRVRERERSLGRLRILLAIGALLLVLLCVAISLLFDSNRDNENLADRVQRHQNQLETLYADQLDLQVTMQIANTSLMNASTALAIVNSDLNAERALEVLNDGNLASAREYAIASGEINPTSNAALTA
ncbi:MAG: toll/interleukin-1 receptor domain-containing protein, partial [Anaerolineae bacterium]